MGNVRAAQRGCAIVSSFYENLDLFISY